MSTEIKSALSHLKVWIAEAEGGLVNITSSAVSLSDVNLRRADFLKAVVDELDVIVVEKDAYPVCNVSGDSASFDYGDVGHSEPIPRGLDADELIALGIALKANPPTDPKVEALAKVLADVLPPGRIPVDVLTDEHPAELVRRGVRVEVTP